jgi:hypothetical protein
MPCLSRSSARCQPGLPIEGNFALHAAAQISAGRQARQENFQNRTPKSAAAWFMFCRFGPAQKKFFPQQIVDSVLFHNLSGQIDSSMHRSRSAAESGNLLIEGFQIQLQNVLAHGTMCPTPPTGRHIVPNVEYPRGATANASGTGNDHITIGNITIDNQLSGGDWEGACRMVVSHRLVGRAGLKKKEISGLSFAFQYASDPNCITQTGPPGNGPALVAKFVDAETWREVAQVYESGSLCNYSWLRGTAAATAAAAAAPRSWRRC